MCAAIKAGEIVIFDKAYVDFGHLADLSLREVFWVTRAKDNMQFKVANRYQRGIIGKILRDDLIRLQTPASRHDYPGLLRRVVALIEVDGQEVAMVFLTNNLEWSATSIVALYRCRWQIEVFFKQIKQTLQLADFLGTSANAVRWQVWTALLVYLLLRSLAFLSEWNHSFSRLFTRCAWHSGKSGTRCTCCAAMGQPPVTFDTWPAQSRPTCRALPESLWDSQWTSGQKQTLRKCKTLKTPNALFQITFLFARNPREFNPS